LKQSPHTPDTRKTPGAPPTPAPVHVSPPPVKRDRLFKLIDGARAGSGLWVSGMAGSGKTTLVASYLQEHRFPFLWYPLDRRDGDLPDFFFRFGSELRRISHRAYRGLPLLTPDYLPGTESFVSGYFAKLFSRIETPLWMVFDNYQDVPPESGFNLVLMALMKFAPPGVVVIVISRDDPPPIMAGMLAARKLVLIDSVRLAFTQPEASELVQQLGGGAIGEDHVRRIYDVTRGWAAGIILLMLKPDPIDRFEPPDGSRVREVFDYLGSEVFEKLAAHEQEFLLKTSILPDISPELVASLAQAGHSEEILSALVRRNFFIERALAPGAACRYHPLFRSFLLDRFARRYPDPEARRLRKKAGDLLVLAGRRDDAAGLYAEAGEWGRLAELIHEIAPHRISQGRLGAVLAWIELLPVQMVAEDPWLLLWKGICTVLVDPEAGWRLCCSAHPMFARAGDVAGCRAVVSYILESAVWSGKPWTDIASWVDEGARHVETTEAGAVPGPYGNLVGGMLAALSLFAPGDPRLPRWLESARASMRASGSLDIDSETCEWLLYLDSYRGEMESARALAGWATPLYEGGDKPPALLRWKLQLCHYHAAGNDPDQGILTAEEGLQLAEQCGIRRHDAAFLAHRAYFYIVKGDLAAARQGLRQLAHTLRVHSTAEVAWYNYLSCLEAYAAGDYTRAGELGPLAVSSAKAYGVKWLVAATLFLQGRVHRACGQAAPAAECLEEITRIADASQSSLLRGWVLLAQADQGLNEQSPDRVDVLARAFEATSRTFYHPALGRESMAHVCAEVLDRDIDPSAALALIDALKLAPPKDTPACRRWPWPVRIYLMGRFSIICDHEPLSFPRKAQKRPLELLILLACCGREGQTREHLADQLWPDAEGDKADQTLSTTLHRLRKLLGSDRTIVQENERIALSSRDCWVDAWHFDDLIRLAGRAEDRGRRVALLSEAVDLYRGEPQGLEPFVRACSRELQEKTLEALRQLGDLHEQGGDHQQALVCWRRGVLVAPTAELFYRRMMRTLIRQGNRTEAAAVYGRCRDALEHALGIPPSKATTELYREITALTPGATVTAIGTRPVRRE
jgi:LuxR family transcriptional regulator, maltose regulon positive regulatory protein